MGKQTGTDAPEEAAIAKTGHQIDGLHATAAPCSVRRPHGGALTARRRIRSVRHPGHGHVDGARLASADMTLALAESAAEKDASVSETIRKALVEIGSKEALLVLSTAQHVLVSRAKKVCRGCVERMQCASHAAAADPRVLAHSKY